MNVEHIKFRSGPVDRAADLNLPEGALKSSPVAVAGALVLLRRPKTERK